MNTKKHSKRLFSMLYSIVFLLTSLFVSIDYIKAENSVTKYITRSQYTEIVKGWNDFRVVLIYELLIIYK